jgi:hypothetical protein
MGESSRDEGFLFKVGESLTWCSMLALIVLRVIEEEEEALRT